MVRKVSITLSVFVLTMLVQPCYAGNCCGKASRGDEERRSLLTKTRTPAPPPMPTPIASAPAEESPSSPAASPAPMHSPASAEDPKPPTIVPPLPKQEDAPAKEPMSSPAASPAPMHSLSPAEDPKLHTTIPTQALTLKGFLDLLPTRTTVREEEGGAWLITVSSFCSVLIMDQKSSIFDKHKDIQEMRAKPRSVAESEKVLSKKISDIYADIKELGAKSGRSEDAEAIINCIKETIKRTEPKTVRLERDRKKKASRVLITILDSAVLIKVPETLSKSSAAVRTKDKRKKKRTKEKKKSETCDDKNA